MKRHRDFKALNCITALQTSCSFLYLCLFIWMPAIMIEAINYTSPVMSYELLGNDQRLKYLFSVLLLLFWFGQRGFWRIVFASRSVIHPCDCLMKYSAIQLYPAETGNGSFCELSKELLISSRENSNSFKNSLFLWLSISLLLFLFLFVGKINPGVCIQRAVWRKLV